jgi:hypothetical protein
VRGAIPSIKQPRLLGASYCLSSRTGCNIAARTTDLA